MLLTVPESADYGIVRRVLVHTVVRQNFAVLVPHAETLVENVVEEHSNGGGQKVHPFNFVKIIDHPHIDAAHLSIRRYRQAGGVHPSFQWACALSDEAAELITDRAIALRLG